MIYVIGLFDPGKKLTDIHAVAFQDMDVARLYVSKLKLKVEMGSNQEILIIPVNLDKHTAVVDGKPVVLEVSNDQAPAV